MRMALVKLVDPSHRLPNPFNPSIDFPEDGLDVDVENPVWMGLIRDGSLRETHHRHAPERQPEIPAVAPAPEPTRRRKEND